MRSSLETLFPTLFPILIMLTTIGVALYYVHFEKVKAEAPLKAKPPRPTQPAATVVGIETGPPHASFDKDVTEGFATSYTRSFPVWTGPSTRFAFSMNDRYYKEYAESNLTPSADMITLVNSLPIMDEEVPNYGAALSNFDADISSIPWDADNAQYLQKDIVWGHVSKDASSSLFLKAYHRKLLSDADNLIEGDAAMFYHSPVLGINAKDPTMAAILQATDAAAAMVGQVALTQLSTKVLDKIDTAGVNQLTKRLGVSKGDLTSLSAREQKFFNRVINSESRNAARQAKLEKGIDLTKGEKIEQNYYNKNSPKPGKFKPIPKTQVKLGIADKLKVGVKKMASYMASKTGTSAVGKIAARLGAKMGKKLAEVIGKMVVFKVITAFLTAMAVAIDVAAVATLGALTPLAIIAHVIQALWTALDIACTVIVVLLQVLLPTLMDRAMKNGSVCPQGKPFDILIEDDFLYFIVTTFIPIGSVLDAFGPYTCYMPDGNIILKTPLYIPPYFADSSLSTSKHTYLPSENPRGDMTTYKSNTDSLPKGWTVIAGIARSPCDPGTWTSTDVDMLCNISTYVPDTYCKKSKVPITTIKVSRVPETHIKRTEITTYAKADPYPIDYEPCGQSNPGSDTIMDGGGQTLDCWMSAKRWSGLYTREIVRFVLDRKHICGTGYRDNKWGLCEGSCNSGDDDWGVFPLCTRKTCPTGWTFVLGVCWEDCRSTQTNVGALCRDGCRSDEYEVLGVCWKSCAAGWTDVGALCREGCKGDTPSEVLGICWGSCGNDIDVGALCRQRCREGFHEVAGVCWGNTGTYARDAMIPKSIKVYDPGYNPPDLLYTKADSVLDEGRLGFPYCNYASPVMLDRMAQFYYDQSTLNAESLSDNRIKYEYIVLFYGVIASSELSCDVACAMKTVTFNPLTGDNYEESYGTVYPDDPGNTVSYRRFYFYRADADKAGQFTVTGCTHTDYTAPDAHNKSTDEGVDPVISVPKVFNVIDKRDSRITFNMGDFVTSFAATAVTVGAGFLGGKVGIAGGAAGGVAGGMAGAVMTTAMKEVKPADMGAFVENTVIGDAINGFFVSTNNDNFSINHGPVYEKRARDKDGYIPELRFCGKINTTELLCSNELVLRDTVDLYNKQNPTKHVKTIYEIEPRGTDGCFYKWSTTSYDAATNTEGTTRSLEEIVLKHTINDNSTCVYAPTTTFTTDLSGYPIRSYFDELYQETKYPTRNVTSTAIYRARYIRIRPSTAAPNKLQLSQVAVYDALGTNLAVGKQVYANSYYTGTDGTSAPPNKLVDGKLVALSGLIYTYQNGGSITDYIDIDLGMNYYIASVSLYGRIDGTQEWNSGIRVQLLYGISSSDVPVKELITATTSTINTVDFTTKITTPKIPVAPFNVPQPLLVETTLGGPSCPVRCQDKPQIDSLVKQFNATSANSSSQIVKVLRAVTPSSTRCDYEVEIMRNSGGRKTVAKELISMATTLVTNTPNTGTVYGRFIRIRPNLSGGDGYLTISQIVVANAGGANIAMARKAYGTSRYVNNVSGSIAAAATSVTDGNLSTRDFPGGTWQSGTPTRDSEFLEIDLGMSQPINSITYYGGTNTASDRNLGVRIQILVTNDTSAVPISTTTLPTTDAKQTIQFNQCSFTYSPTVLTGNFIQSNTPLLESVDTLGGVLTFKNIGATVMSLFNSVINPIRSQNPLEVLTTNVNAAETAATNTLTSIAANQTAFQGCPNIKCNDPAVLSEIITRYNGDNRPNIQYGAESNTMVQIAKAGVAGPNMCDVLFTNLYESYDDIMFPPVESERTTMTKRFKMTNTGNCVMTVAPGITSVVDVSMNAIGIMSAESALTTPYSVPQCQVNCRDPVILASVKQKLTTQYTTTSVLPTFGTVLQSYPRSPSICEYMFSKDVTTKNINKNTFSTEKAIDTYISASFNVISSTCAATLDTVTEYDPDMVTTITDKVTDLLKTYINGVEVNLPYLFNYDNTTPSTRVNETAQILS